MYISPTHAHSVDTSTTLCHTYNTMHANFHVLTYTFLQELGLDCVIEITQAPGLSAYNRAERKMFHLSKELSGLVLPAETFGSHLQHGKTIDEALEEKNFESAGEVLADVWNKMVIDEHDVTAEYISVKPTEDIFKFSVSLSKADTYYKTIHDCRSKV